MEVAVRWWRRKPEPDWDPVREESKESREFADLVKESREASTCAACGYYYGVEIHPWMTARDYARQEQPRVRYDRVRGEIEVTCPRCGFSWWRPLMDAEKVAEIEEAS